MKKIFFLILISTAFVKAKAQAVPCSFFCITSIEMDTTLANTIDVTLFMSGTNMDFINYPYVSMITDSNGDTIATGTMNFFAQAGHSFQTYQVSTNLTSIPANFTCTVYFNHDTVVCTLSYPCTTSEINNYYSGEPKIYPNPSDGKFRIENGEITEGIYSLKIYTNYGAEIYTVRDPIQRKAAEIDLSNFPKGIYFIEVISGDRVCRKKIITY